MTIIMYTLFTKSQVLDIIISNPFSLCRYLYTLRREHGIQRTHLDEGHITELSGPLDGKLFKGLTIDEEGI